MNQIHIHAWSIMGEPSEIDRIAARVYDHPAENVILNFVWEAPPIDGWIHNYTKLITSITGQNKKIFVLINSCYDSVDIDLTRIAGVTEVLPVDFFPYYCYQHNHHCKQTAWNEAATKFLYLNGHDKVKRFWLLHTMAQRGQLMSSSVYSWHPKIEFETFAQHDLTWTRPIGKAEYEAFQSAWARTLEDWDYRWTGCRFDPKYFKDTAFSLVIETHLNVQSPPWVTEKSYLPILNHRPFIIAGDVGSLAALRHKGFKTFEDLLPVKNYDEQTDTWRKIDALVENVEYLSNNIKQHQHLIRQAVSHNYITLCNKVDEIRCELTLFIHRHGLDPDIDNLLPTGPFWIDEHFEIFYQNIKDPSWPDCHLLHQFDMLPESIQAECLDNACFISFLQRYEHAYLRIPRAWLTRKQDLR